VNRCATALAAFAVVATLAVTREASARPAPPICADLGADLGVGVSDYSEVGDWDAQAAATDGVRWRFIYWYVVPTSDPPDAISSWLQGDAALAQSLGAVPVFTFYELLEIGQQAGLTGAESDVVQQVLASPSLMSSYFDHFVFVLQSLANEPPPVIVHVEPDSWGFMMWSFGVEGNGDASSVPVMVASSGYPDVAGFSDDAGGFGKALLKLRDEYAPQVRLGWHASNFREGTGGDVVSSFYGSMGAWDVLVTEHPHVEADPAQWWLPWDEAKVQQNLSFFSTLTQAAGTPILLWQEQLGTTDYHLFDGDPTMLTRFADAGVGGVLFSMRGDGDPDDYRADEDPNLAIPPPTGSDAGGTAADMRARVAVYTQQPLAWPDGSICAPSPSGGDGGASASASAGVGGSASPSGSGSGSATGSGGVGGAGGARASDDAPAATGGCGCVVGAVDERALGGSALTALALALAAAARRTSRRGASRRRARPA
jgi:hypothetical protein